jgi:predicted GH43/DUF377 family glycosyl hydrolase
MKWVKKGLVYSPDGEYFWAKHSALTPTPLLINPNTIRIFAGFRDEHGVSRIGFVDVDANDPSTIKDISKTPVLDVGRPGTFDDNGIILGDVIEHNQKLYMYYVGFQLVEKAKFLAFTGLAISSDGGITFERYSNVPILDRSDEGLYFRAVHSVMIENGVWKAWCGVGSEWEWINGTPYPRYNIRYLESSDGLQFNQEILCVDVEKNEYRIGRPRVYKRQNKYLMFYTRGTVDGDYIAGYAESFDGKKWIRKDNEIGITLSETGWDSKSLCYPSLIEYGDQIYMFYNGNNMGKDGFGYAVLEEW